MSKEITLTTIPTASEAVLRAVLDEFEQKTDIHVRLHLIGWENYRSEAVGIALRHTEGDVLVVGTPITSDLIGMNALRPFTLHEIAALGGPGAFLPSRWESGKRPGSAAIFAVPWVLDIRALYFWRDMLAQAGIDEATAFISGAQFRATLECLKSAGTVLPWASSIERYHILHAASSWIWERGGDLFSPDGRQVIFHEPRALEGIYNYLELTGLGSPGTDQEDDQAMFRARRAAVFIGNAWPIVEENLPPELGCVPLPGGSYVGGSDLMIFAHSRKEEESLALVRFMSQADVQWRLGGPAGLLSPRLSELTSASLMTHPVRGALARAALTGRTYPCVPMIGLVEDRLSAALSLLQTDLRTAPAETVAEQVRKRIQALGNRTNLSLR